MTAADTPATAVAVLRKRAGQVEDVSPVAFAPVRPDFLRAVADLMEAVRRYPGLDAQRAALERLIEGDRE